MKPSANQTEHIYHPLNQSKTKNAYSFQKSDRFHLAKSFSPNKFYDIPNTSPRKSPSIGIGNHSSFERLDTVDPGRYKITSCFDNAHNRNIQAKTSTFGISRDDFYRGKAKANQVGPGAYNIKKTFDKKNFYIGRKVQPPHNKSALSSLDYFVDQKIYNKLSNFKNNGSIHMKTQYYPKTALSPYDNKIPGPGSYTVRNTISDNASYFNNHRRKVNSSFGIGQKLKTNRSTHLGPGRYKIFSQFGNYT